MNEAIHPLTPAEPPHYPEARQAMLEYGDAARTIIGSDWIIFDHDDTTIAHDPESQYWAALHTLAVTHGEGGQFSPNQFVRFYEHARAQEVDHPDICKYIAQVRDISMAHTGDPSSFERLAAVFRDHPHDGEAQKQAIKSIPMFAASIGPFWVARSQLLRAEGVPPTYGITLMPGMLDLINQLRKMSKNIAIISNSRADLVIPALDELLKDGSKTFHDVLTLGGSEIPIKPDTASYYIMRERHGITRQNSVYIGNSLEDISYAQACGLPAIIIGKPLPDTNDAMYVEDFGQLAQVVRQHTDGASISRVALRSALSPDNRPSDELARNMSKDEVRAVAIWGLRRLWSTHLERSIDAYNSQLWSDDYLSLRHIPNFATAFGPILGEIRTQKPPVDPLLTSYYTSRRMHETPRGRSLRGEQYFACVDTRLAPEERILLMAHELHTALDIVRNIDRASLTPGDLLYYLGVLDNAKQQALSVYHASIFNERQDGIPNDSKYLARRQQLLDIAVNTTRSFFEACIGKEFSSLPDPDDTISAINISLLQDTSINPRALQIQEFDHPLKIMLAAYSAAAAKQADTVVSFPSGGTQLSIATALANELFYGMPAHSIQILSIPLSHHSGIAPEGARPISDHDLAQSVALFKENVSGKRVTIVDDNSSTGRTMMRGTMAVQLQNPAQVSQAVGEIDPQRMAARALGVEAGQLVSNVADLRHKLFETAAGVVPVTRTWYQLREEMAKRILGLPGWRKDANNR